MSGRPPSVAAAWTRALQRTAAIRDDQATLLADIVAGWAATQPDAPAIIGEAGTLTYGALAARAARCARWAAARGFRPGDVVALAMANHPDYVAIWLGLSQAGVVTALVNTQLAGPALAHALAVAEARAVVVGAPLLEAVRAAAGPQTALWLHGGAAPGVPSLDDALAHGDGAALRPSERPAQTLAQRALLIYTSGTTGLPKAANVSHYRVLMWSQWFAGLMDARPEDRLYDCLPLYHSTGGVVAVGAMLASGASVVVRARFSASRFWDDVAETGCTVFQYIGELCRYLVNQPERAGERAHRLRLACGNGLRGDVWERFKTRFAVPQILEFYAATEGTFSLFNLEERPGAIGRIPGFMAHRAPVALVRFDADAALPQRGADGFCIRCGPDEPGEAIGRIAVGEGGLASRFEGYSSAAETERKVLRNVFTEGDAWFRTGDLMRRDAGGFYYFLDRIGHTFRWKGENVACCEVEAALVACPGVLEAAVYGVAVPGAEGRAGMAALVVDAGFDRDALRAGLARLLPAYARPLFLRLRSRLEVTATFKPTKQALLAEGFDPALVGEPLFVEDPRADAYVALEPAIFARIMRGTARL